MKKFIRLKGLLGLIFILALGLLGGQAAQATVLNITIDSPTSSAACYAKNASSCPISWWYYGTEAGAPYTYSVTVNGQTVSSGSNGGFGSHVSMSVPSPSVSLSDGAYDVVANVAGGISATQAKAIVIDNAAPAIGDNFGFITKPVKYGVNPMVALLTETSTNFTSSDITVTGGTISNFVNNSAGYYTMTFTPTNNSNTTATFSAPAGVYTDLAGNSSTAWSNSLTVNTIKPTVTLSSATSDPTSGNISVTATFSQSVSNFVLGNISVTNGTAGSLSGSGTTYTFVVTPTADGLVTISLPADAATNVDGNGSLASNSLTRTYSSTPAPASPVISTVAGDDVINAAEKAATVTVTGTTDSGTTVTLNGNAATVAGTSWSYVLSTAAITAFGEGAETLTAVATNAGGSATGTRAISVDSVAPTAPVINAVATDDIINAAEKAATVTVTGTNESGSTVKLNGNATTVVTATTWSYVLSTAAITAFGEGAETLTAVATDAAGNTSSGTRNITVDSVAPTSPVINVVAGDDIINSSEASGVTVTGTNESGSTVKLNGNSVTVLTSTTWSYALSAAAITAFGQGAETLTAVATDASGNTSSGTRSITVDTVDPTAPVINVVAGDDIINATEKAATVTVTGTKESGSTVTLNGNATTVVTATTWSYVLSTAAITAFGEGAETLTAVATDAAGNTSSNGTRAITVDSVAPTVPVINIVAGNDVINAAEKAATVTVTGTNESGSTVTLNGNATTVVTATTWSYVLSTAAITALGEGAKTLTAVATDAAGNTSSGTRNITIDSAAPAAPVINAVATDDIINAAEKAATVTVTGTNESGSTVTLNGNATTVVTATTWSYVLSTAAITAFGEGAETLTAVATDAAGNTSSGTRNITVDSITPTTPVINIVATDDIINAAEKAATVTVTGTNESGSTVTLNGNATTVVTGTTWSYVLSTAAITAFGEGAETLTAVATDAAGNVSANGTRAITVDSVVPTIAITDNFPGLITNSPI
ncbi:MAG: Ig-like domain-containing protein, partial [Candidatus Falkowbacteria bacterium]